MTAHGLIDAGAMVALLDRRDSWHARCQAAFKAAKLPLLTSTAVLAEVFRLVGEDRRRVETTWGLVRSGAIVLGSIAESELAELQGLMTRNPGMSFADATLVYLARRESVSTILTVDSEAFAGYFITGKRKFTVLPE